MCGGSPLISRLVYYIGLRRGDSQGRSFIYSRSPLSEPV